MKGFGIFCLVMAAINLIIAFGALASGNPEAAGSKFGGACMVGVVGGLLIHFANQRKKDDEEKRKWKNGEDE
ncbi:MAG: hypothetical protein II551_03090 [Paludibacteraceae bacterium]|nr:hypothetical protein [Paludibacteraceae bacterium]